MGLAGGKKKEAETRRVKLGNTRLHSAEASPDEVNFNSAAVATNKNPLINRDVSKCECFLRTLTFGLNAVS